MATGYTYEIHDGKPVTFRKFALTCARAFGVAIELRDTPLAELPHRLPRPDAHHAERLAEAHAALAAAENLTLEEAARLAAEAHAKSVEAATARERETAALRKRYEDMLAEVRAWEPPTKEHEGLKAFMTEQLESSIKFDCGPGWEPAPRQTPDEFKLDAIKHAMREVEYHAREMAREAKAYADRQAWVDALYRSLEPR